MRTIIGIAALAAALSALGCIEKETTHSIYLSPDGAVAWTTLERDVRSTAEDAGARGTEEATYLAAALAGTNDVAEGLAALEPLRVQTRVLRRERPFSVLTEARFTSVQALGLRILGELRIPGDVYVTQSGEITTLHIHLDCRGMDTDEDRDTAVTSLVDELSTYRIVLTEGHFVEATGFALEGKDTIARPVATSQDLPEAVVDLSLAWRR
jgi:hypothetical protein